MGKREATAGAEGGKFFGQRRIELPRWLPYTWPVIGYTSKFSDLDEVWAHTPIPSASAGANLDVWIAIERRIEELRSQVSSFRQDVDRHIIQNQEPNPYDWIQHRYCLHHLLARLDELFLEASRAPRVAPEEKKHLAQVLEALDRLQAPLAREFIEWHGKLEDQADIPADLIQAFADIDAGRTIEVEQALNDAPPSVD